MSRRALAVPYWSSRLKCALNWARCRTAVTYGTHQSIQSLKLPMSRPKKHAGDPYCCPCFCSLVQAPSEVHCRQEVMGTRREDGDGWSCGRSRGTAGVVVPVGRLVAGKCVTWRSK
eukprot:5378424-Pyramimonas_sp.AAC.1